MENPSKKEIKYIRTHEVLTIKCLRCGFLCDSTWYMCPDCGYKL